MTDDVLAAVEHAIGYSFRDHSLLAIALRHASSTNSRTDSNERLEFLGDAVLGLVVCDELYDRFPDLLEGDLTKIKSMVVSRKTCAAIIDRMEVEQYLVLGKGMLNHDTLPGSVAAAMLESLVGAIFLDADTQDAGVSAVRAFLMPWLDPIIVQAAVSGHQQNFKSVLQQYAQETLQTTPQYILLDEQGPDHAKCFEVCAQLGAERYESCWGQSKKIAEQRAALIALRALGLAESDDDGNVLIVGLAAPQGECENND